MSDNMTETTREKPDAVDNKAASALAHALWITAMGKDLPADTVARKAAWSEAKREQVKMAKTVLRRLEKRGFALTGTGAAADSEDEA